MSSSTTFTIGFVEGMNNKLKLIKRQAFGYRNFAHFCLRVLVECEGYGAARSCSKSRIFDLPVVAYECG